ncbi:hypothetical protein CLV51_102826 [Chitinophaga niastensis]|uniref:DUF4397 domain-containing protein n=1 Tax=Chitinophaga niastensis TaxID=536980 RepID=A0A2P8HP19_CHINA|nr:hypothetical protein [Chitinophaga niastensis]PSL47966.1 hypothetical protein CLV51_102826 [Chitinophaga niastensis]
MTKIKTITVLLLLLSGMLLNSCVKDKVDNRIPLLDVSNKSASAIRLFNFSGTSLDVTVNNIPLTAYSSGNTGSAGQSTQVGLSVFPTGTWPNADNGSPFTVPNSLLDKSGKIHLLLQQRASDVNFPFSLDTIIANDVLHPLDYYVQADGTIRVLNRDNVPASNGQNFKVRIINLGRARDVLGLNGPVSLTYSDGSKVNDLLNNIAQGSISPYVEMPYGAYQFKLFVSGGMSIDPTKQLAELPQLPNQNPCAAGVLSQEGIISRVRTFKPGGVYSIVITPNFFEYFSCDKASRYGSIVNSYRVITEVDPGVNYTYARMQAVNALPGKQVTVQVDGQPAGGVLDYIGNTAQDMAQHPAYTIYIQGHHTVQATDAQGTVLATADINLYPYDNYTIWVYEKPDGKTDLLFESNDMTGSLYRPNSPNSPVPDDGTDGTIRRTRDNYAVQTRFLNLSPDLPYATFTNDQQFFLPVSNNGSDTIRYPSAYIAQATGRMPERNPAIIYSLGPYQEFSTLGGQHSDGGILPRLIRVFKSEPGNLPEIPGTLLSGIAPLDATKAYISNAALYTPGKLPLGENGVYTVALVGKTFGSSEPGAHARLVLIKHNK